VSGRVISSLKAIKDISEAMVGLRDAAAFQEKRLELQSKMLEAQSAAFAANEERATLIERVSSLEQDVAHLRAWDSEKQRYELKQWADGAFAYALKETEAGGEPMHAVCPGCYQRGTKSILQSNGEIQVHKHAWNCFAPDWRLPLRLALERTRPGDLGQVMGSPCQRPHQTARAAGR
jgi:hypothetical protein